MDDSIEALDRGDREALVATWLDRAAGERRVGVSFQVILESLLALRAPEELIWYARRAIDDEIRHGEICRQVASRFAGRELGLPAPWPLTVPTIEAAEDVRHACYVIGQCVLNETTASVFLEGCLAEVQGPLVRAAVRELLADEIDHARLGWAFLATLEPEARERVSPWLLSLVQANLAQWRRVAQDSRPALVAQGLASRALVERAPFEALENLIVPGLELLGFSTAALKAWLPEARGSAGAAA
jgi:hypothetical protein